jgi:flagellum-specific peptidoglycan hydrolase FlgJ
MLLTRSEWTKKNAPFAIQVTKGSGIFPETLLAMAIVESQGIVNGIYYPGAGLLAKSANNFFGIKKGVGWTGQTITLNTPGDAEKRSTFRKYANFTESAKDYINFLKKNKRYTAAGVFDAKDYVEQIVRIAKAGYAESQSYTDVVTKVATKVKDQIKDIIDPLLENNKIAPVLIAGLIISLYLIKQKLYA